MNPPRDGRPAFAVRRVAAEPGRPEGEVSARLHATVAIGDLPADADVYLCGGAAFLQALRAQLRAAEIPSERVHFELFSPDDWLLD